MHDHLAELNPAQREAATKIDVPLLVLAGAGAGKTKTITHRILHIVKNGVTPDRILAVTFTNKAAKEMRERIAALLQGDRSLNFPVPERALPYTSTFHALGVRLIRDNARMLGLPRHFAIFDRADSLASIKQAIRDAGYDPKQFEPRKMLSAISRQKGRGRNLEQFAASVGNEYFPGILADVWQRYQASLREDKALDFDDLLLKTLELLRGNEGILKRYQSLWEYIHVDEYQDTNAVQFKIIKLLAQQHRHLCVVGDIDQMIYSWRGATLDNIMQFENAFPEAETVLLEENYRSTQTIVHVSNEIIKKNVKRKEKTLYTKNTEGEKITLYSGYDEADEAAYVALKAKELIENGREPSDIAVLYRANFQSRVLEEAFLATNVPYRVLGTRFFERKEVKDVLSFIRAGLDPESQADVRRIINVPPRGIGKVTLLKLLGGKKDELSGAVRTKIEDFYDLLREIGEVARKAKPSKTVAFVLDKSGLGLALSRDEEGGERLENIRELASLATRYDDMPPEEGIAALLENAALQSDQDELEKQENAVALMTIHAAKGLEFPIVFITGLEDGLFPHERIGEDGHDDEEERRLFYVALTRAREKVYLCYAQTRLLFGSRQVNMPSEFITDIDDAFLEADTRPEGASTVIYID